MYNFSNIGRDGIAQLILDLQAMGALSRSDEYINLGAVTVALDNLPFQVMIGSEAGERILDVIKECNLNAEWRRLDNNLRLSLIEYLQSNDRNGCYYDWDCYLEGLKIMTLSDAIAEVVRVQAESGEVAE